MSLGLYISVALTSDSVCKPTGSRPMYPRSVKPLDSFKKTDVFRMQLCSMKTLPISKIILNVVSSSEFSSDISSLYAYATEMFPNAEIVREQERSTKLEQWRMSSNTAVSFFGVDTPVIWVFNHDHIFVDYRPEPFIKSITTTIDLYNKEPFFLIYSHAPENIALSFDTSACKSRLALFFGHDFGIQDNCELLPNGLYRSRRTGSIDGIFVTTPRTMRWFWNSTIWLGDPRFIEYAPRPDWPGVSFPSIVVEQVSSTREFFRHFDGYGHVMTARNALILQLDTELNFPNRVTRHRPEVFHGKKVCDLNCSIEDEALSYSEIFFDLMSIALRDNILIGYLTQKREKVLPILERLYQHFISQYLDSPGELNHLDNEDQNRLHMATRHFIFSRSLPFIQDATADCQQWL